MTTATIAFVACTLLMASIGLFAWARSRGGSASDYLLADRSSGAWATALSGASSDTSGWVVMGLIGIAFTTGVGTLWVVPAGWLGYALNWWLVAERLRRQSAMTDADTLPHLLSAGGATGGPTVRWLVRLVAAVVLVCFLTTYMSGQSLASGKLISTSLGVTLDAGIWIALALVFPYLVLAGFRGVVWSDMAQATLILVALLVVPTAALLNAGGLGSVLEMLRVEDPALASFIGGRDGWSAVLFVVFWLSIGLAYPGQPHILARFMAARSSQAISSGRLIALSWFTIIVTMSVLTGVCARAAYAEIVDGADSERVLPILAAALLPGLAAGAALAAVLAASITTLNSQLFSVVSSLLADTSGLLRRPAPRLSGVVRTAVVLLVGAVASLLATFAERDVFNVVLDSWSILGAAFGPAVIYTLWVRRSLSLVTLIGMVVGASSAMLLTAAGGEVRLAASVAAAAAAIAIAHAAIRLFDSSHHRTGA